MFQRRYLTSSRTRPGMGPTCPNVFCNSPQLIMLNQFNAERNSAWWKRSIRQSFSVSRKLKKRRDQPTCSSSTHYSFFNVTHRVAFSPKNVVGKVAMLLMFGTHIWRGFAFPQWNLHQICHHLLKEECARARKQDKQYVRQERDIDKKQQSSMMLLTTPGGDSGYIKVDWWKNLQKNSDASSHEGKVFSSPSLPADAKANMLVLHVDSDPIASWIEQLVASPHKTVFHEPRRW